MVEVWLQQAVAAAREAGAVIRENLGRPRDVRYKGPSDPVTEIDLRCQELVRSRLLGANPTHGFLGEEEGGDVPGDALWIVDPLDGTKNFSHGYPVCCVSIGLEVTGKVELGVVYDPNRDELFTSIRGQGALLNGRPIQVSEVADLADALIITGFARASEAQFDLLADLERRSHGIRRDGSAALNLCYVAAGRLDAFWECGLNPWDMAAGGLILEEAGGMLTDLGGKPFNLRDRQVLATNVRLHRQMVEVIGPRLSGLRG